VRPVYDSLKPGGAVAVAGIGDEAAATGTEVFARRGSDVLTVRRDGSQAPAARWDAALRGLTQQAAGRL
jgi:hypothetical protein